MKQKSSSKNSGQNISIFSLYLLVYALSLYVHSVLSFSVEKQSIITLDAILLTTLFVCVCRVKQQQRFRRRGQEQQILQINLVNGN